MAVAAILLGTCKVNVYEHQASERDKQTYIRRMEEADILRDVLHQSEAKYIQGGSTRWITCNLINLNQV